MSDETEKATPAANEIVDVAPAPEKKTAARWQPGRSGNPAGRKSGAEKIRQMLEPHKKKLFEKAVAMALEGDAAVMRILFDRMAPPQRAESPTVYIPDLASAPTLTAKAEAVAAAVGQGLIGPDAATMLLQAIAAACKVVEFDDHERRLREIEKARRT